MVVARSIVLLKYYIHNVKENYYPLQESSLRRVVVVAEEEGPPPTAEEYIINYSLQNTP